MITTPVHPLEKKDPKEEILKAALKLFTEKGYFNTSIADIRQLADVSTGTIYHYFKNKEAIADALYTEVLHSLEESLKEIRRLNNAFERLRAILELFFELTENEPEIVRFIVTVRHQEILSQRPPLSQSPPFRLLNRIMEEGIRAGDLRRMNPQVATAVFYGTVARMALLRLEGVLEKSLELYLLDTWTAIWRALAPANEKGA
ncbi:TetR/AcrR family transcriptional regulator, repressor of fatR-cypB operon [Methylomarinovum caldicuralii]|uniref:TetR/AcrR family transcriptional regulator, repressor of fatR-cypB operon n=1 Tax=Methylomarinovum caldicuralii TaxID=438856 RepID=A0AAU9C0V2_9GAMM|nr:TetR/AcrR family transcriptional regulator, repressor of fatR-cypB operon [Methylomarinovum caldicuralii]